MTGSMHELLAENPVLLLFVVLAIGFVIGRVRFGSVELGPVVGVLVAGLLFGHLGFEGDPSIQSLGLVLFIFSIGYQAGPRLAQAAREDGRRYLAIAAIVAVTGFVVAYGSAQTFDLVPGMSAGVLAGGLTSAPALAAADAAVQGASYGPPVGTTVDETRGSIAAAYAITYVFGLVGLTLIVRMLPSRLAIDLAAEADRLEQENAAKIPTSGISPGDILVRAMRVDTEELTGRPLRDVFASTPIQFAVLKIRRGRELIQPDPDTELQIGDAISVIGFLTQAAQVQISDMAVGAPVRDRELLHYQPESVRICVTDREAAGLTLGELEILQRHATLVSRVERMGMSLDVAPTTRLERGDVVHVTGPRAGLDVLADRLGHVEREAEKSDLRIVSWAIVLGLLLGAWSINLAGVSIGLGTAGGLLVCGLLVGYLSPVFPVLGELPDGARWVVTELGLLLFMAGVGLHGGATVVETLLGNGPALLVAGVAVTTVPLALAYLYGRSVLRMSPPMLLGALAGAMTSRAALSVVNKQSRSTVADIGYTGTFAFVNILLMAAGTLLVLL